MSKLSIKFISIPFAGVCRLCSIAKFVSYPAIMRRRRGLRGIQCLDLKLPYMQNGMDFHSKPYITQRSALTATAELPGYWTLYACEYPESSRNITSKRKANVGDELFAAISFKYVSVCIFNVFLNENFVGHETLIFIYSAK